VKGDHLTDRATICSGKYGIPESSNAYAFKILHYVFYCLQDIPVYAVKLGYYVA
jgi:hypothetical protein